MGQILVNTGDGKGKSTAAFGVVFRAIGQGMSVAIIQFIKGSWKTGEMEIFKKFDNITHIISGDGFTWVTNNRENDIKSATNGWNIAKDIILGNSDKKYNLLVLDEFNLALHYQFLDLKDVLNTLKNREPEINIIITGRNAPKEIVDIADTVTNMTMVKHAYEKGIDAVKGIEF